MRFLDEIVGHGILARTPNKANGKYLKAFKALAGDVQLNSEINDGLDD